MCDIMRDETTSNTSADDVSVVDVPAERAYPARTPHGDYRPPYLHSRYQWSSVDHGPIHSRNLFANLYWMFSTSSKVISCSGHTGQHSHMQASCSF